LAEIVEDLETEGWLREKNIPARGIEGVNCQKNSNGQKFPIEPKIRERVGKL
jgi:hypothetical protein